jgi:hypothetical protein
MIVYRAQEQTTGPSQLLARIRITLQQNGQGELTDHGQVVELLIDFGELEAGVVDALCPERDSDSQVAQALRQTNVLLGHAFYHSWRRAGEMRLWLERLSSALTLNRVAFLVLPEMVRVSVPEGYVYYGLYPETYLKAAVKFFHEVRPSRAVGIGIRSIGTSLSAVVCAALEELGCETHSYTVRPRGHPFDRRLALSPRLEEAWRSLADSHFLIIDEGPGCATVQASIEIYGNVCYTV